MRRALKAIGSSQIVMRARSHECFEINPPSQTERVALWHKRLGQYRAALARQTDNVFQILDARAARIVRIRKAGPS